MTSLIKKVPTTKVILKRKNLVWENLKWQWYSSFKSIPFRNGFSKLGGKMTGIPLIEIKLKMAMISLIKMCPKLKWFDKSEVPLMKKYIFIKNQNDHGILKFETNHLVWFMIILKYSRKTTKNLYLNPFYLKRSFWEGTLWVSPRRITRMTFPR